MKFVQSSNGTVSVEGTEHEVISAIEKLHGMRVTASTKHLNPCLTPEVKSICENGDLKKHYQLGNMICMKHRTLGGSGKTIDCRVVRICDTGMMICAIYPLLEMQFDSEEKDFDSKRKKHPTPPCVNWGSNVYSDSAIHQFLNSDKKNGEWWMPQHRFDNPPNGYDKLDGFLAGFDDGVLDAIGEHTIITAKNNGKDGEFDILKAKFFLPSKTEMFGKPNNGVMEGEPFAYSDKVMKGWNWLRSPYTGSALSVDYVYTSGALNDSVSAHYALGVAPACVIGKIN